MFTIESSLRCASARNNPRDGCPLAPLGSELARSDKRVRDGATTGFSRMVEILAAHFDQARPAEARKRAMATALLPANVLFHSLR